MTYSTDKVIATTSEPRNPEALDFGGNNGIRVMHLIEDAVEGVPYWVWFTHNVGLPTPDAMEPGSPLFFDRQRALAFPNYNRVMTLAERASKGDTETPCIDWCESTPEPSAEPHLKELAEMWGRSPELGMKAVVRLVNDLLRGTNRYLELQNTLDASSSTTSIRDDEEIALVLKRHELPRYS